MELCGLTGLGEGRSVVDSSEQGARPPYLRGGRVSMNKQQAEAALAPLIDSAGRLY
jgi:hypothetical protein